ncbi:MAG TPA: hypothetical protein VMT70_21700 [Vicinamibacteria bacterium]|nr:hypothetical protein [Vicinamibacteria bacterium]
MRLGLLLLGLAAAQSVAPPARAQGKVETIGAFTGPAAPSVLAALEPGGYRVRLADGTVACDVWFRKDLPGLVPSALVAVLSFPQASNDFRGQPVKAGSYTLRYAVMPSDGNHMGVAPTTDFLLLSPLADDKDASALPDFATLAKMSAKTIGANHPAPLNLAAVAERKDYPAVAKDEYGHEVFHVKLRTAQGERAIGLVVKGQFEP